MTVYRLSGRIRFVLPLVILIALFFLSQVKALDYTDIHGPHFNPSVPQFNPAVHEQIIYEYTFVSTGLSFGGPGGSLVGDLAARTEERVYFSYQPGMSGPAQHCKGYTTRETLI
jgi:hypothetical protein